MKPAVLVLAGALVLVASSTATTFVVTKETDDDGPCTADDCSLREATLAANADPFSADVIVVPAGTYRLTLTGPPADPDAEYGDLDLRGIVDVRGAAAAETVIVAPPGERVLDLEGFTVELTDLTLTGGEAWDGAGIRATFSRVTIRRSTIAGNRSDTYGGGLFADLSAVSIVDSVVRDNSAEHGGGIAQIPPGIPTGGGPGLRLTIVNSTISGNEARLGGGLYVFSDELTVIHSTVADNRADAGSAALASGSVETWRSSLVVGDCGSSGAPLPASASGGNVESPGATCGFSALTDQVNVPDPLLGPFADHGGPTLTHALLPGSPAIDAGLAMDCPPADQRGVRRPRDGDGDGVARCDAGAFEADGPLPAPEIPVLDSPGLAGLALLVVGVALRRLAT